MHYVFCACCTNIFNLNIAIKLVKKGRFFTKNSLKHFFYWGSFDNYRFVQRLLLLPAGFSSFRFELAKIYSFAIFGCSVGLCELQTRQRNGSVCMAFRVDYPVVFLVKSNDKK